MSIVKAGIREFRAGLAEYILGGEPVAVTRHGQTVGVFIPTQASDVFDEVALRRASQTLDSLLAVRQIDSEEIVTEFKEARRAGKEASRDAK
ncbi:MAG: type II toxin-antitoxin system Phd/YefM family antitoxin [Lautropia sp.]|nr:type II toxin-antitoxin system Phd/YefM family antitoxin [Lautropia sp.]